MSLREKEIGIRLALGSSRERIVQLLLYEESRWLIVGTLTGVACAISTGYALRSRFYGVHSTTLSGVGGSCRAVDWTGADCDRVAGSEGGATGSGGNVTAGVGASFVC